MNRNTLMVAVLAIAALAGGVYLGLGMQQQRPADIGDVGFVYPQPREVPPLVLIDHHGKPFDNERLKGNWTFLFFGYTFCPDICPMALSTFSQVAKDLREGPGGLDNTRFVFVSVDPDRDTPERLKDYVTFFDPEFLGVTGDNDYLQVLTLKLGIVYAKVEGNSPENYLVDHSSAILLANPQGQIHAVFTAPHSAPDVANALRTLRTH